jgi:hypothetical protein
MKLWPVLLGGLGAAWLYRRSQSTQTDGAAQSRDVLTGALGASTPVYQVQVPPWLPVAQRVNVAMPWASLGPPTITERAATSSTPRLAVLTYRDETLTPRVAYFEADGTLYTGLGRVPGDEGTPPGPGTPDPALWDMFGATDAPRQPNPRPRAPRPRPGPRYSRY